MDVRQKLIEYISFSSFYYDIIYNDTKVKGDFMKEITLILRFVVIGLIYLILFRLIKTMIPAAKGTRNEERSTAYALEVIDAPDLSGLSKGSIFLIHDETIIGRKEDNQIVINDPYVSSKHAIISVNEGRLLIEDLESTNGTILNGKNVEEIQVAFKEDILEIGRIIFKVIG
jgi:hypothetical protein